MIARADRAAELALCVAAGQLNVPIQLKAGDTTSLMAQLKSMQDSLLKVVSSVRLSSDARTALRFASGWATGSATMNGSSSRCAKLKPSTS